MTRVAHDLTTGQTRMIGIGRDGTGSKELTLPDVEGARFRWRGHLMRAEELHAKAQKCKRLASEIVDPVVRDGLIELASDYERQAASLEEQQREATQSISHDEG